MRGATKTTGLAWTLTLALAVTLAGCALGSPGASAASAAPTIAAEADTPAPPTALIPTASPTLAAYAPPCATSQLRLALVGGGGAMGHGSVIYQFTNISQSACSLKGFPTVRLLDGAGRALPIKVVFAFH